MGFRYLSDEEIAERRREQERATRQSRRRYDLTEEIEEFEHEDDEECIDRESVDACDVVTLWRTIERHRTAIAHQEARFQCWLQGSPSLAEDWARFQSAGGVTADDFDKFVNGKMRHCLTPQRKHLRLIRAHRNPPIRRTRSNSGNDAA